MVLYLSNVLTGEDDAIYSGQAGGGILPLYQHLIKFRPQARAAPAAAPPCPGGCRTIRHKCELEDDEVIMAISPNSPDLLGKPRLERDGGEITLLHYLDRPFAYNSGPCEFL